MPLEHKIILFVLVIALALVIGFGIGIQFQRPDPDKLLTSAGIKRINSFDKEDDLRFFEKTTFPLTLSSEHVTDGMSSLKVTFPDGGGELSAWRTFLRDWSAFQVFSFDIYNDQYSRVVIDVTIKDEKGEDAYAEHFYLLPGSTNQIEINLTSVGRRIDLRQIRQILFSVREAPGENTFFLDNLRLEKRKGVS